MCLFSPFIYLLAVVIFGPVCDGITERQWRQKVEVFRHSLQWYYQETMETES